MKPGRVRTALFAAAALWAFQVRGAPALEQCPMPDELAGTVVPLPAVAEALKPRGTLRVLAVGSATMFGPDAALTPGTVTSQALGNGAVPKGADGGTVVPPIASDQAFPRQMGRALEAAVPGVTVQVVVRGGRGMTAADMLALMRTELEQEKPQLVLWQTGTVEAVRNVPQGEFAQTLADGAQAVEEAGANLVLIDPQYSRFLQANSNLDPYTQALQQTASFPGVLLFHRFDLMRSWASAGQLDLERTARGERRRAVEKLHACLGTSLARLILAAVKQ